MAPPEALLVRAEILDESDDQAGHALYGQRAQRCEAGKAFVCVPSMPAYVQDLAKVLM